MRLTFGILFDDDRIGRHTAGADCQDERPTVGALDSIEHRPAVSGDRIGQDQVEESERQRGRRIHREGVLHAGYPGIGASALDIPFRNPESRRRCTEEFLESG